MSDRTCSVEGCSRYMKYPGKGLCRRHYERLRLTGTIDDPPAPPEVCSVAECGRPHVARGWCHLHWRRWRENGDPGSAELERVTQRNPEVCIFEDCANKPYGKGYCRKHFARWKKHGDASVVMPPPGLPGRTREDHPAWKGDDLSYAGVHSRIYRERGSAAGHSCVDCGRSADDWSYTYEDPNHEEARGVGHYSLNIEFYVPRCKSCHRTYDHAARKRMAP